MITAGKCDTLNADYDREQDRRKQYPGEFGAGVFEALFARAAGFKSTVYILVLDGSWAGPGFMEQKSGVRLVGEPRQRFGY